MTKECDIILLSYESPGLLKKCVESVLEHTKVRSTLIIVDNNSVDPGVKQYLNKVDGNETVNIEKVFCAENTGFARGMNKGILLSNAPFVCLLNNDCVVTQGWLGEMTAVAASRETIGLVNPQSNTFGSLPDHTVSIDEHAKLLSDKKGRFVELGHAIGFACLVKKEVIEKIGHLDEGYEGVCYEDTDFSIRARNAGYVSVMAEGAYVFHAGQASRKGLKGRKEIYARNRARFEKKWGKPLRVLYWDRLKDLSGDRERVMSDYETLKNTARQRAFIDMWIRDRRGSAPRAAGIEWISPVRHADIGVKVFRGGFVNMYLFWKVFTKKKRYDAVILRDGFILRALRSLKALHGTRVFSIEEYSGLGGNIKSHETHI